MMIFKFFSRIAALLLPGLLLISGGCAIHYYDEQSGIEHLWGFGHLKMRAVPQPNDQSPFTNAVLAYVTGVQVAGLNLGAGNDFAGISAGWDSRSRVIIQQENSQFYLLWPTNSLRLPQDFKDLFTIRIGTNFPFQPSPLNLQTNAAPN